MITLAPIPAPTISQFMSHPQTPTQPITQPPPHQTFWHPKAYAIVSFSKGEFDPLWPFGYLTPFFHQNNLIPLTHSLTHFPNNHHQQMIHPLSLTPNFNYSNLIIPFFYSPHHWIVIDHTLLFLMVQIDCRTLRTRFYVKRAAMIERAVCPKLNGSKIILVGVEMYFYYFIF